MCSGSSDGETVAKDSLSRQGRQVSRLWAMPSVCDDQNYGRLTRDCAELMVSHVPDHIDILLTRLSCGKSIGDVLHLSAFGEHIVVLGNQQVILDLLDKQSIATSDRPQHALIELCVHLQGAQSNLLSSLI